MNLTREEAHARAAILDVDHYDVALDLTTGPTTFRSRTTVTFSCSTPGASTFIDCVAPNIISVELNGQTLDPKLVSDGVRIDLVDLAAQNTLTVITDAAYMNTGEGLHRFVDPADGEVYLYTQFEVADSRRVFAVFEQPDLKATFAFTVTAPAAWTVFSNETGTPADANGTDGAPAKTWTFPTSSLISSYLTAIVAGPYQGVTSELTNSEGRVVPLGVYARASLAQFLEADEVFDITRAGFAFYEKHFDTPYPFSKYDQIFVPEFNAGAMENAGCVTFTETYVFRSKVPEATIERRAVTILHELAHMWFGDLVTMKWWDDLWLNESFAEFMSTLACAEATRWTSAWTTFSSLEKSWAYRQDQLPSTHPIWADIRDLEDVEVNFDGITYAKGASVLRQLVAYVGPDAFFKGVQEYFHAYAWSNTTLKDFLRHLENASGRDLNEWARLWLQTAQVNTLRPVIELASDGVTIASLAVEQTALPDYPTLRPHRLVVAGYDLVGGKFVRTHHEELDVDGPLTEVPSFAGRTLPDVVLINDGDLAYAKVRLDHHSLAKASAHLAAFDDTLARTLIWNAAWDMTRDGEMSGREYVELVLDNIAHETDSTVILVLLRQLTTTLELYIAQEFAPQFEPVGARLWAIAQSADAGSDLQLQLLKAFAVHAKTEQQLDWVEGLLEGKISLPGLAIDTDLRWELLTSLAAGGRAGKSEIDAQLATDSTAAGERAARAALAAIPTHHAKHEAWKSIVDRDDLPNALQTGVITGFNRIHDAKLLEPFAKRYFDMAERVWTERAGEMAQNLVVGLYPVRLAGIEGHNDIIEMTQTWLTELDNRIPALARLVSENLAAAKRAVAAQAASRQHQTQKLDQEAN